MKKVRLKDLNFTLEVFTGRADNLALVKNVRQAFEYSNGKKTETVTGTFYDIVNPENAEIYLPVKVLSEPILTQQDLDDAQGLPVTFEGIEFKFYINQRGYPDLSVSATNVKVAGK